MAQIDRISNIEHIFEKLFLIFLEIWPTTHWVCALFFAINVALYSYFLAYFWQCSWWRILENFFFPESTNLKVQEYATFCLYFICLMFPEKKLLNDQTI